MTTDNKYNGWANYATWRINLEIFDCFDIEDYSKESYELSKQLEDYVEEIIFIDVPDGLAKDYAGAFIRQVNYYEIAEHLVDAWKYDHDIVEESEV
jgi:hypothetical protein